VGNCRIHIFHFEKLRPYVIKRKRKRKLIDSCYGTHLYRYEVIDKISPRALVEIAVDYIDEAKDKAGRVRELIKRST